MFPIKFIVWGLELHIDTHSYIHYGYHRAALQLGWDSEWVTDTIENQQKYATTDGYLFLTVGHACTYIPINPNAFYILHNCVMDQFDSIPYKIVLQVYTKDIHTRNVVELREHSYEFWQEDGNVLYAPWATDLLPHEIDENIEKVTCGVIPGNKPDAIFLGTVWDGVFGNINELNRFKESMNSQGLHFIFTTSADQQESIRLIQEYRFAPTIVGTWQKEKGYIPCRIFKTISYGQMGITNSIESFRVVGNHAVYHEDECQLAKDAVANRSSYSIDQQVDAMKYVRDHHTYINRLQTILSVFERKCV